MKILFVSASPFGRFSNKSGYNGCGWIASLVQEVATVRGMDVAVAFPSSVRHNVGRIKENNILFFPIRRSPSPLARFERFFRLSAQDKRDLSGLRQVVAEFHPDVIFVFGTENCFGLISRETDIPVVIHMQGLLGPYLNAWVPPGWTMADYVLQRGLNPVRIALGIRSLVFNRHAANRERRIMSQCQYFMGRTEWDRAFVSAFAPQATYFSVWETLRQCFYKPASWHAPRSPVFVSTVSNPFYKGHDMILKTANILRETGCPTFLWRVFGVKNLSLAERKTGIRAHDVGVVPEGVVSAEGLREALLGASVYVHPSYIDNSPNSVCEAQILGVPVVATNVGGVSSLFLDDFRHCLVPANDPVMAASRIRAAMKRPAAFAIAPEIIRKRHDPQDICDRIVDVCGEILRS